MKTLAKNSAKCFAGESAIAYLYGELAAAAAAEFEVHLTACERCRDEFAELSDARFDVYEWHKLEFVPMETPAIVIPYEVEERGWAAGIRAMFAPRQRLFSGASLAAASFVMIAALGLLSLSGNDADLAVAEGTRAEKVSAPIEISTPEVNVAQQRAVTAEPEASAVSADPAKTAEAVPEPALPRSRPLRPVRERVMPAAVIPASTTPPRLNDFEDSSDDSLRLSDIFEDIETS